MHLISKKICFFILLLSVSCNYAYSQILTENNSFQKILIAKSERFSQGRIEYTETQTISGLNKPMITSYVLLFSKNLSVEVGEFNINLFNEQDSILYIANKNGSYTINYKDKQLVIDNPDKLLSTMSTQMFFSFYGAQIKKKMLISRDFKEIIKDYSTKICFTEEKLYADYPDIRKKKKSKVNNILCAEEYEFRIKDTLLTKHISQVIHPNLYVKGSPTRTETTLLYASLDNSRDYETPNLYDYTFYITDDFQIIDRRTTNVTKERFDFKDRNPKTEKDIALLIAQLEEKQRLFQSQLEKLEQELIPLLLELAGSDDASIDNNLSETVTGEPDMEQLLSDIQLAFLSSNDSSALNNMDIQRFERQQILNALNQLRLQIQEQLAFIEEEKKLWNERLLSEQQDTSFSLTYQEETLPVIKPEEKNSTENPIIEQQDTSTILVQQEEIHTITELEVEAKENHVNKILISEQQDSSNLLAHQEEVQPVIEVEEELLNENPVNEQEDTTTFLSQQEEIQPMVEPVIEPEEIPSNENSIIEQQNTQTLLVHQEETQPVIELKENQLNENPISEEQDSSDFVYLQEEIQSAEETKNNLLNENSIIEQKEEVQPVVEPEEKPQIDTLQQITKEIDKTLATQEKPKPTVTETKQASQTTTKLPEGKTSDQIIQAGYYYIVLGCFKEQANAVRFLSLQKKTHANVMDLGISKKTGLYMVGIGPYKTREEANTLIRKGIEGWIITK